MLRQPRAARRYLSIERDHEEPLTRRIAEPAGEYGRYGTPRITALPCEEGRRVNHKRVERIRR